MKTLKIVLVAGSALLVLANQVLAHGDEDHSSSPSSIAAPVGSLARGSDALDALAPLGSAAPQRLADGSLFVPKVVQRQLGLRTRIAEMRDVPASLELAGKVVANANAGGLVQAGQAAENSRAVLWIISGHHFARRLVIRNDARRRRRNAHLELTAVDLDLVTKLNALAGVGHFVVHSHMAFGNEALHLDARAHARLGQDFVQLRRFRLWQEHALFWRSFGADQLGIKLT